MRRSRYSLLLGVLFLVPRTVPAAPDETSKTSSLAGTWTWSWKDTKGETHRHVLEVEGSGTKLAARERFDELEPVRITDLSFEEKKVKFTVQRGEHRAEYSGVLDKPDTINGTVTVTDDGQSHEYTWKAEKKPAPKPADK